MAQHSPPGSGNYGRQEPLYDTSVATPSHAERARTLCCSLRVGTLSTLTAEGAPYGSFVTYGMAAEAPVLLVSALAEHTQNLRRDPRASLLVAETGEGDPLAMGRVTLTGSMLELARGQDDAAAREAYLAAVPSAEYYVDFKDFSFWRLTVSAVRYIGGYGRMSWVDGQDWCAATPDPVALFADRVIQHMNEDHAEAMARYCRVFSKATDTTVATITSVDRYGFEMSAITEAGPRPIRLAFGEPVTTVEAVRREMVELSKRARAAESE